jgi:hypothetical protein
VHRFEAGLPNKGSGSAWPAAFPPFAAGNGIEVVCLTDEAQLKAEGSSVPDASGSAGLDHCVGGYGRECFTGQSHIASIRRVTPSGYERLSTVEFEPGEGDEPGLDVSQHYGERNRKPSDEAITALEAFLEAVDKGAVPLSEEALSRRSEQGFGEPYDWRVPEAMDQAFFAWSGFLPRDVARGGLPALHARIGEILRDLPPASAIVPATQPRVVVINAGMAIPRLAERNRLRLDNLGWMETDPPAPGM